MFTQAFLFACMAVVPLSICHTARLPSPCPELFNYELVNNQGYWIGSLVLRSDYDLRGIWIRLIFNEEVTNLTVDPKFHIKYDSDDKKMVKLQNPDLNLAADENKILKIKVTYEASEVPSLIEYRLNARTICLRANITQVDVFKGDTESEYFLPYLQTKRQVISPKYECGVSYRSNQYPWQAAVYLQVKEKEVYTCDAILIHPSYLITAAHCVTVKMERTAVPKSIVTIHFGQDGKNKNGFVQNIIVHPGYKPGFLTDDVAVLRLSNSIDITNDLRPICLGFENKPEYKMVLSGYELGKDGQILEVLDSDVLRVDFKECSTISPHLLDVLTYDTYCVSYKSDNKYCVGNSGSGLVSIGEGKTTLRGLVALGARLQSKSTCNDKTNVIIIDIDRYLSFINNVIN